MGQSLKRVVIVVLILCFSSAQFSWAADETAGPAAGAPSNIPVPKGVPVRSVELPQSSDKKEPMKNAGNVTAGNKKPSKGLEVISPASKNSAEATQKVTLDPASNLISLDYSNANLNDVLKAISYSYDLNIVVTKDISGKVSAKLDNLTLEEALGAILSINNYAFSRKGNIVYVMPKSEMELTIESIPLNFLTPKEAKEFLGSKATVKGDIQPNLATNSLIVKADPSEMENIRRILKTVDAPPIQVLIEAKIVDINANDLQNIGTNIKLTYNPASGNLTSATLQTGGSTTQTAVPPSGSLLTLNQNYQNVSPDVQIDALVNQHRARILASPSIATLNGKEASITIGQKVPYVASTAVTGSTSTASTSFADIGTKLRVTPTVSLDGWITMKVHPEVSTLLETTDAGPNIATREADATVRVRNNETIVIGGLINRSDLRDRNGVPVLRDIPVLGWFFKRHKDEFTRGNLTVFITPHIIPMPPSGGPIVQESRTQEVDILKGMLKYADTLENDKSKDLARNAYINMERIRAYRMIVDQFPQSSKSSYCLYKIAFIYAKEFGRCEAAKEALMELKATDTESEYIGITESLVGACMAVHR